MKSVLSAPHFHDEAAALKFLEARVWRKGPVCPHCGGVERISKMEGKSTRLGTYKCYQCRMQFTVKVGTVFESSHVKLHLWLQAVALLSSSKKGISSNQLQRTLGVSLKTAWFMSHRIREAMRDGKLAPMGGNGSIVEMDETYHGKVENPRDVTTSGRPYTKSGKTGPSNKRAIVALVERGGNVRSFHVEHADQSTVTKIVNENLDHETRVHTDESKLYFRLSGSGRRTSFDQSSSRRICARRRSYQQRRELLLNFQTRNARNLPALQREESAPIFGGVRFSTQCACRAWRERSGANRPHSVRHRWQAANLRNNS